MENPPHPEGFVLRQCIEPLGSSMTGTAALGVTRATKRMEAILQPLGREVAK
ncbi:MAG: hypothetical protein ACR2NN_19910 [Bryobacteraceae bacterium]